MSESQYIVAKAVDQPSQSDAVTTELSTAVAQYLKSCCDGKVIWGVVNKAVFE